MRYVLGPYLGEVTKSAPDIVPPPPGIVTPHDQVVAEWRLEGDGSVMLRLSPPDAPGVVPIAEVVIAATTRRPDPESAEAWLDVATAPYRTTTPIAAPATNVKAFAPYADLAPGTYHFQVVLGYRD